MKKGLVGLLAALSFHSCVDRKELLKDAPSSLTFSEPVAYDLPAASSYAEKRKFADFDGDGVEDMMEVDGSWGSDYKGLIFPGVYKDDILVFDNNSRYTIDLPLNKSWGSTQTKIDAGDVNGDGKADLIFTEYKAGLFGESYVAKFALNQGDGKFAFAEAKISFETSVADTLGDILLALTSDYYDYDEVDDYLKMDWSDFNNDGQDDLILLFKDGADLYTTTIFTGKPSSSGEVVFSGMVDSYIPHIMANRYARVVDTSDLDGNGISDILVYARRGESVILSTALGNQNEGLSFTVQKDYTGKGADLDFFAFEKNDSFDGNNDGLDDYVHLGKNDGNPTMVYKFTQKK